MTANFGGGAIVVSSDWGEGNDQLWGSGRRAIAGWVPISVSYLPPIFKATNFTETPEKTTINIVLNFLQTLYYSVF